MMDNFMSERRIAPLACSDCVEALRPQAPSDRPQTLSAVSRVAELTRQLHQVRTELFVAMRDLGGERPPLTDPGSSAELVVGFEPAETPRRDGGKLNVWCERAANHVAMLTPRQREVMTLVVAGRASKRIAVDLNISQRTVENHRASIMRKTGAASLPALARLALAAGWASVESLV